MEYLDYFNRHELISERSRCSTELNQLKIKKEDESENLNELRQQLDAIIKSCDERLKAQKEANTLANQSRDNALENENILNGQAMVISMQNTAKQQQILDTVRATQRLKIGDCVETFICGMNQLYSIEVKPKLEAMPTLENEFINVVKGLLTYPMYTQMEKSGKQISTWSDLQTYLMATHGRRISNYQHLHRLWNCRLNESEKLSDFGARLEDKVWSAAVHIQASYKKSNGDRDMSAEDVFHLFGALLAALQIKESYGDAYKSLIKTCDKHWTASSLLSDASDYVDKMTSGEVEDTQDVAFHTKVVKTEKPKKKKPVKNSTSKRSSDRLEDYKRKCKNQICEAYLKNACKYGDKCFRIHPQQSASALYAEEQEVEPEVEPEVSGIKNLFHQGP